MILSAFLVAVVISVAATVFASLRGFRLYRQAKHTSGVLAEPLASFEAKAAEVDRHLDAFETSSRELEQARARLARSRAQLQVLRDAIERAQAQTRWLRSFLPAR